MKKVVPFIFPLIALIIVLGLLWRWYNVRTNSIGQITPEAQNIEVNDITPAVEARLARQAPNLKVVELLPPATATMAAQASRATIRYEESDGSLNFSITADLPMIKTGYYQVWFQSAGKVSKAMILALGKGGWTASGSVKVGHLPLEITLTHEETDDEQMERILLKGQIQTSQ